MNRAKGVKEITAANLTARLMRKYNGREWIFLPQVRDTTGLVQSPRTIDGLAFNTWPSRGFEIHGFEIKVNRSDWRKELMLPEKAEAIFRFCDRWWIVADSLKTVPPVELPKTWGLMLPHGGGLRVRVQAPRQTPDPIDAGFMAAVLRRAYEYVFPKPLRDELRDKIWEVAFHRGKESERKSQEYTLERGDAAMRAVALFEERTGMELASYNVERHCAVANLVSDATRYDSFLHGASELLERLKKFQEKLAAVVESTTNLVRVSDE